MYDTQLYLNNIDCQYIFLYLNLPILTESLNSYNCAHRTMFTKRALTNSNSLALKPQENYVQYSQHCKITIFTKLFSSKQQIRYGKQQFHQKQTLKTSFQQLELHKKMKNNESTQLKFSIVIRQNVLNHDECFSSKQIKKTQTQNFQKFKKIEPQNWIKELFDDQDFQQISSQKDQKYSEFSLDNDQENQNFHHLSQDNEIQELLTEECQQKSIQKEIEFQNQEFPQFSTKKSLQLSTGKIKANNPFKKITTRYY